MKYANDDTLRKILRKEIKRAGSQFRLAREKGIVQQHISAAMKGEEKIRPSVAAAIGYKPKRVWVKVKRS